MKLNIFTFEHTTYILQSPTQSDPRVTAIVFLVDSNVHLLFFFVVHLKTC